MREPRLRLRQRLPLVGRRAEGRELRIARRQRVAFDLTRRGLPPAAVAALDRFAPGAPGSSDFARQGLDAAEGIEQLALRFGPAQRLMRVLAVQVDQAFADVGELGQRRRATVDVRTASSLRIEHAAQQQRSFVGEILRGEPRAQFRRLVAVELGGDFGSVGARTQLPRLEAIAEQQRQRVEQDRFAGARFAGQHGEAGPELDLECLDDGEIANGKQAKHRFVVRRQTRAPPIIAGTRPAALRPMP